MTNLKATIAKISLAMGGGNILETEDFATLSKRCAKFGVTTDTKELGELYDSWVVTVAAPIELRF